MQREIELTHLCKEVLDALRDMGLGKYSLRNHYYEGMWPIIKAYRNAGTEVYDPALTDRITADIQQQFENGLVSSRIRMNVAKANEMLQEYTLTGKLVWHRIKPPLTILLTDYYENILKGFRENEERRQAYGDKRLRTVVGICRTFFSYLESAGHPKLNSITLQIIKDYLLFILPKHKSSVDTVQCALKNLCEYVLTKYDCCDFRPALTSRPAQRKKLMPVFSQQEVLAIAESVQKSSHLSLRDAAAFSIAENLGVRAVDIVNLKLRSMNWECHEIKFTQHKTGIELVLPLEPSVGNAIADYVLHERPSTESEFLFVRSRFPFDKMTATALGDRLRKHMRSADMERTPGDHKGFHSFRRYVATTMINSGGAIDTVKEILGHTQMDSMKPYIRVSQKGLLSCALGLDGIEVAQEDLL